MLTETISFNIEQRKNISSNSQRNYNKAFETYFVCNLQTFISDNKNCLQEIDQENRTINKNDKFWIQTHLKDLYQNCCEKLEKQMMQRNNIQRQQINVYKNEFQRKKKRNLKQKLLKSEQQQDCKKPKYFFRFITDPVDKRVFLHSMKLQNSFNMMQSNRKKESFSSRRYRKNDDYELQNIGFSNTRYVQKLQRIKLESTYTRLFFQEHINTIQNEQDQPIQIKRIVSRIKAISAARNNFRVKNLLTVNNNKDRILKFKEEKRWDNFLVNQIKTQTYKPKSRQRQKLVSREKLILNFNL